jgi:mRNA interferase MazF
MTRGEIWLADLGLPFGSEPGFIRPVLVIQDNSFNLSKIGTTIVISITSNLLLEEAPGNIYLDKKHSKLAKDSIINISQIATIDKKRLIKKISKLDYEIMEEVEKSIKIVLGC